MINLPFQLLSGSKDAFVHIHFKLCSVKSVVFVLQVFCSLIIFSFYSFLCCRSFKTPKVDRTNDRRDEDLGEVATWELVDFSKGKELMEC